MNAAMIRASCKTIEGACGMHRKLLGAAKDGRPLCHINSTDPTPCGWDSPAFASNLYNARRGVGVTRSRAEKDAVLKVVSDFEGGAFAGGLQRKAYHALLACLADDWDKLISRRALVLCPGVPPPSAPQLLRLREELVRWGKAKGSHNAMYIIKTLCNGWGTTSRFHEEVTWPCILGCESETDSLVHYLRCSALWTLSAHACGSSCEHELRSPHYRLCLSDPSFDAFKVCGVAFWLYHALKVGHRDVVEDLVSQGDFAGVRTLALELLADCAEVT